MVQVRPGGPGGDTTSESLVTIAQLFVQPFSHVPQAATMAQVRAVTAGRAATTGGMMFQSMLESLYAQFFPRAVCGNDGAGKGDDSGSGSDNKRRGITNSTCNSVRISLSHMP